MLDTLKAGHCEEEKQTKGGAYCTPTVLMHSLIVAEPLDCSVQFKACSRWFTCGLWGESVGSAAVLVIKF